MDDAVFKALNDPSRRRLLDSLHTTDGQMLVELVELLPDMTRFGVMNHLRVLEEAELVVTRKVGRNKLHYLNPVPIREVHDRWISKYTESIVGSMVAIKHHFQGDEPMPQPDHVYQVIINADPNRVWEAMVDGEMTQKYFYGTRVESDWEPGAAIRYYDGDGNLVSDGEILEIEDGRLLDFTFQALWDPDLVAEGPAREIWRIDDFNGAAKLTIELYEAAPGSKTLADFTEGFPYIVSGMKTLLETGDTLPAPA